MTIPPLPIMPLTLLLLFSLLTFPETQATTDFWTKANKTLLLSQTRRDTPTPYTPPTRDPILDNPAFLPLCGNGKIDTKADYRDYYKTHTPLSLTKQQILYGYTPEYLTDATMLHNITILADEECDDGNRQDLDGCSADCMHMDLWTSACEIAVDKTLLYEDMTWDPARQTMVASAADGIYSLEMDQGTVRAQLLAPKSFPATNIFKHENSFVIYSAANQSLWLLSDDYPTVLQVRDFTFEHTKLNGYTDRAYQHEDGSFFLHDENKIVYLEALYNPPFMCACPSSKQCIFKTTQGRNHVYQCFKFDDPLTGTSPIRYSNEVIVGPRLCQCNSREVNPDTLQTSLIADTLQLSAFKTGFIKFTPYRMDVTVSPPEDRLEPSRYVQLYHPMGVLLEFPNNPARKMGTTGITMPNFYYMGESSLFRMLTGEDSCGPTNTLCALDTKVGYDLMQSNPLKDATPFSWGDILQSEIMLEASRSGLTTLQEIRLSNRYWALLDIFTETRFKPITTALTVLSFQTHPVTRNLWALRRNRLVEISKSGVQAQLPNGKCLPIGLGLCQECQWAPSGLPCRPCANGDSTSASWAAKCDNPQCSPSARRLLTNTQEIRFTLWGNLTTIHTAWPTATCDSTSCSVKVTTTDPIGEMKRIRETLTPMLDVQVLTQPYQPVYIQTTAPDASTTPPPTTPQPVKKDDFTWIIVLSVSIGTVLLIVGAWYFVSHERQGFSKVPPGPPGLITMRPLKV